MKKKNIIGTRIRKTRQQAKPPITQEDLVARLQLAGLKIDQAMISRIESGTRLVTDIELKRTFPPHNVMSILRLRIWLTKT